MQRQASALQWESERYEYLRAGGERVQVFSLGFSYLRHPHYNKNKEDQEKNVLHQENCYLFSVTKMNKGVKSCVTGGSGWMRSTC